MNRLAKKRIEKGLTQRQAAQASGMTIRGYRNYERQPCPRSIQFAITIAKYLGASVEELFGEDGSFSGQAHSN